MKNEYWIAMDDTGTICAFLDKPEDVNGIFMPKYSMSQDFYQIPRLYQHCFIRMGLTYKNSPIKINIKTGEIWQNIG